MTDWIKAMNPVGAIDTQEAALAAARVSAFGMVLGAVKDGLGAWYTTHGGAAASQAAIENLTGQAPSAEQLQSATSFGIMGAGAVIVLQLVLAVVQWKKPNQVLPILFMALVVLALGGTAMGLVGAGAMHDLGMSGPPTWLVASTLVLMVLAFFMHLAGIRGASVLKRFRDAQNG